MKYSRRLDHFLRVTAKAVARMRRTLAATLCLLVAALLAQPACTRALAQTVTAEEDLANTAAYYTEEMKKAAQACDRTRYDRAFLGLRGVLGQVDSDIARERARLAGLEESYKSSNVFFAAFSTSAEYRKYYEDLRVLIQGAKRQIARLNDIRKDVTNRMNNRPPFRCPDKETGLAPQSTPQVGLGSGVPTGTPAYAFSVGVEGGFGGGHARFAGTTFEVPVDGGVAGFYFDARTFVSPNVFLGARVGVLFGDIGGVRINPANDVEHEVETPTLVFYEGAVGGRLLLFWSYPSRDSPARDASILGTFGGVVADRKLTLSDSRVQTDSQTSGGVTASLRVEIPITPMFDLTGSMRYVRLFENNFFNGIRMDQNLWIGTIGIKVPFYEHNGMPVM